MIRGVVRPTRADGTGLEAIIPLHIAGSDWGFRSLEMVVDTGYTGWVSLPAPLIRELGLRYAMTRPTILADGQAIATATYAARVLWHGQPLDVWVQEMNNRPTIGTDLLYPCHLAIDLWDGGAVVIEERTPPAQPV